MINTTEVYNKIIYFFKIAFINFGKEVTIPSNDFFVINQISDSEKETLGEYNYYIQYGFFNSGCICLNLSYFLKSNEVKLNTISIFAPSKEKANLMLQEDDNTFTSNVEIKKYDTINAIAANPKAIEILDSAITNLSQTIVLGEYTSSSTDKIIPCCAVKRYIKTNPKI